MNFILSINFDQLLDPIRPYLLQLGVLFGLLFCLMFLGLGAVFKRSGKPAIGAWIPFYNLYLLFEIVYQKGWKVLFLLIPFYNLYLLVGIPFRLSKMFGHGFLFGVYLFLFPVGGYPILGFEDAIYEEEVDSIESEVSESVNSSESIIEESALETPDLDLELEAVEDKSSSNQEVPAIAPDFSLNDSPEEKTVIESPIIPEEKTLTEEVSTDSSTFDDSILADIESIISKESSSTKSDSSKSLSLDQKASSTDSSVLASELSILDSILSSK